MTVLAAYAVESGKTMILGSNGKLPAPLRERSFGIGIRSFAPEDYSHLCRQFLEVDDLHLEISKVHRFAPKLNAHQLKLACAWCRQNKTLNTEGIH